MFTVETCAAIPVQWRWMEYYRPCIEIYFKHHGVHGDSKLSWYFVMIYPLISAYGCCCGGGREVSMAEELLHPHHTDNTHTHHFLESRGFFPTVCIQLITEWILSDLGNWLMPLEGCWKTVQLKERDIWMYSIELLSWRSVSFLIVPLGDAKVKFLSYTWSFNVFAPP